MFNYQPMQQYPAQIGYPQQTSYPAYMEVDGRSSIERFPLPPNTRAVFFSSTSDRFFSVRTDALGGKDIREYEFSQVVDDADGGYLTVREFNEWRARHEQPVQGREDDVQGIRQDAR